MDGSPRFSVYLHIPFCQVRCAYCDFNTYAGLGHLVAPYMRTLAREVELVAQAAGRRLPVHTVFFGGGTPSLVPLEHYRPVFSALAAHFDLAPDCEITLEANPGTVDGPYLAGIRALGVNRLSFGVQSSQATELRLLDRLHDFATAVEAVRLARAMGFTAAASRGLNLDLIFGLPEQTLAGWRETLERVLALAPEHLSLYALSLEHGTPLRAWVQRGLVPLPDPDLAADMYHLADDMLRATGYRQYEISNWALGSKTEGETLRGTNGSPGEPALMPQSDPSLLAPGFACRHNLQYWRNGPYLGLGAGAHGSLPATFAGQPSGRRYANVLAPGAYIERVEAGAARPFPLSPATAQTTEVNAAEEQGETMMLGLRLVAEGVRDAAFRARFGLGLAEAYHRPLRHLKALGLIGWDEAGARLTPAGRLLGNRVFREFV